MPLQLKNYPGWIAVVFLASASFQGCAAKGPRAYYSREAGAYTARGSQRHPDDRPSYQAAPDGGRKYGRAVAGSGLKKAADSYLGIPYRWGGEDRSGMDCSGFIRRVFADVYNISLPHNSAEFAALGRKVPRHQLKRGDIVLFGSIFGIHHAGIYMEKEKFIHASTSEGVVYSRLDESYYRKKYKGARRLVK